MFFPSSTVTLWLSANGGCSWLCSSKRPSQDCLVSVPCRPRMGIGWPTPAPSPFPCLFLPWFYLLPQEEENQISTGSRLDGATGRKTEKGGDRGGKQRPREGILQRKTSKEEGKEQKRWEGRERKQSREEQWLAFLPGFTGPVLWVLSPDMIFAGSGSPLAIHSSRWCQSQGACSLLVEKTRGRFIP